VDMAAGRKKGMKVGGDRASAHAYLPCPPSPRCGAGQEGDRWFGPLIRSAWPGSIESVFQGRAVGERRAQRPDFRAMSEVR
jgi:hypothetical protein